MFRSKQKRRGWSDLSPAQQNSVKFVGLIQVALFLYAVQDLIRRSPERVRGRRLAWVPVLFVNFVGPIAYLTLGRRG